MRKRPGGCGGIGTCASMAGATVGVAYQFEREGYFCRDNQSDGIVFNKTVGLRDTWS